MKNIDINEWLLNNGIEPLCEIVSNENKIVYLSDLLEKHLKEQLSIAVVSQQRELCEGKCGMSYCDDNGCIDRKRNLVEPKDKPEHCG